MRHSWTKFSSDRLKIEHRVEARDFKHSDLGHPEIGGDIFEHVSRQPTTRLALRQIEQRDHRALLTPLGITRDDGLRARFDTRH